MNQQIFNRKIQAILNEVKEIMRSSFAESGITQEALADESQTTQPSINRWYSYDLSHFPPIYHLALIPEAILVPICNYFLKRFSMRASKMPEGLLIDGHMEDEILAIDVIIADIIKVKDCNPEKAIRMCDRLLTEGIRLQKEAQTIVDAKRGGK
jgi:hypothetical protein